VLRSLGSQRELPEGYVDDLSAVCGEPTLAVQSGDWLLLCSDGIWGTIEDDRIRTVLSEALDPQTAARALVDMALHAGAPDNATALVARCLPATWR
jgi:serine/threonine protein phosphatase PrpC